ncbi:MAG: aldehyde dehydrogenase family protein [Pseudorhodobacter sp.]|nr:aldehyde dehydrogenase family protein [Pseudorhodobacter sp.]
MHELLHDAFVDRFVSATKRLRVGDPLVDTTDIGPKVSLLELEKVERLTAAAIAAGTEPLLLGGRRLKADPHRLGCHKRRYGDRVYGLEAYLRKKIVYANFSGRSQEGLMPYGT